MYTRYIAGFYHLFVMAMNRVYLLLDLHSLRKKDTVLARAHGDPGPIGFLALGAAHTTYIPGI